VRSLAVLLVLSALVLSGCGGGEEDEAAAPPAETTTGAAPTAPPNADRPAAPPIAGTTLDGKALALADFRGRPVLVNVWSSW
jgi:cytochrome oxidase Cu insertion factor (SCO1/SenC/PrrC family)